MREREREREREVILYKNSHFSVLPPNKYTNIPIDSVRKKIETRERERERGNTVYTNTQCIR